MNTNTLISVTSFHYLFDDFTIIVIDYMSAKIDSFTLLCKFIFQLMKIYLHLIKAILSVLNNHSIMYLYVK